MTDQCPICLEHLIENIGVAVPCGHCFHRDCFERLKKDSEQRTDDILQRALLQRCCICKKKVRACRYQSTPHETCLFCTVHLGLLTWLLQVRKFHSLFLNFDPADKKSVPPETSLRVQQLQGEKEELAERLNKLQALSSDQSEILCRLVPRHDHLEARYAEVKKERQLLKRQLDMVEDENWDLRFSCFDAEAKLQRTKAHRSSVESKLEEAVGENHDLHEIWDSLEQQLEVTKTKRKSCKSKLMQKLREKCQQLDTSQQEMEKTKKEKEALQAQLSRFCLQVSKLKSAKKKRRAKSKHRMQKVNLIA